jgi:hypothetical protein
VNEVNNEFEFGCRLHSTDYERNQHRLDFELTQKSEYENLELKWNIHKIYDYIHDSPRLFALLRQHK